MTNPNEQKPCCYSCDSYSECKNPACPCHIQQETTSFIQVGKMFECGHCKPEKGYAIFPDAFCDCKCHINYLKPDSIIINEATEHTCAKLNCPICDITCHPAFKSTPEFIPTEQQPQEIMNKYLYDIAKRTGEVFTKVINSSEQQPPEWEKAIVDELSRAMEYGECEPLKLVKLIRTVAAKEYERAIKDAAKVIQNVNVSFWDRTDGRDDSGDDAFLDGTEVMEQKIIDALAIVLLNNKKD